MTVTKKCTGCNPIKFYLWPKTGQQKGLCNQCRTDYERRHRRTPAFKTPNRRYRQSSKNKANQKRYIESTKGRENSRKRARLYAQSSRGESVLMIYFDS